MNDAGYVHSQRADPRDDAVKILYVSGHPHLRTDAPSGYATHMRETMRALAGAGCEVRPWVVGDLRRAPEGDAGTRDRPRSVLRRVVPGSVWQGLRDAALVRHDRALGPELVRVVREERPDVVYERAAYLSSAAVRAARAEGVPLLLEVNAPYVEERRALHGRGTLTGLATRWEREVLQGAALVVTVSGALARFLAERGGIPPERVRVLPNAVDPEAFHPDVPSARGALGFAPDAFVVGYVGSFIPWHRLDLLLRAVAAVRGVGVPAHALLVGDGPARADLEALAAELGVTGAVTFTGALPFAAVPSHVQAMDVCAVPGHAWYCSPIKLFEYGGAGKPVVACDSEPVREVVDDGVHCLLPEGGVDAFAAALVRLHADPALRARLGTALAARVRERHTWPRSAAQLVAWMREVAG